jgi:hypothetical protein
MFHLATSKGSKQFHTAANAAAWLEKIQPISVDVVADGAHVELQWGEAPWLDESHLRAAIREACEAARLQAIAAKRAGGAL